MQVSSHFKICFHQGWINQVGLVAGLQVRGLHRADAMKESARMVGGVVAAVELQVESLRLGRLKHLRHDVLPRLAVVANVAHIHRSRGREVALEIIPDGAIVTGPALHSNVEIGLLGCWLAATVLLDSWCFASSNGIHLGQGNWSLLGEDVKTQLLLNQNLGHGCHDLPGGPLVDPNTHWIAEATFTAEVSSMQRPYAILKANRGCERCELQA
mmetsp:Transcript_86073/g.136741  ORF Transcript_86073/g.136741 Transcript_86073/m.136741 type:complete len:213 (+) Transcript_86073:3073-3711(+)